MPIGPIIVLVVVVVKWVCQSFICKETSVDTIEDKQYSDYCNRNRKCNVGIKIVMWNNHSVSAKQ